MDAPFLASGLPDYADRPSFFTRHRDQLTIAAVFLLTVVLNVVSFPPFNAPEFAYCLAVPAIFWAYRSPRFKVYGWTIFAAQGLGWIFILAWLYHVTWVGLFLLGPFVGAFGTLWYLLAFWAMRRIRGHRTLIRIVSLLALAGAWVILEWARTWFFGGFPWLPLSASQWKRPLILQISCFTGAWGVSFLLIFFNLGLAAYAHRLFFEGHKGLRKRSPEFMVALIGLIFPSFLLMQDGFSRGPFVRHVAKIAIVQPYIPQTLKWDPAAAQNVLDVVQQLTLSTAYMHPDLILEPESVSPWPLARGSEAQAWYESLAKRTAAPVITGADYVAAAGSPNEAWYNAAIFLDPKTGLGPNVYAKRKLVPFGEYVPLRPLLGWLKKVVPIGDDFTPGKSSTPFPVTIAGETYSFGMLVCYEDIFPALARENVLAGADVLAVVTNNAWYGEGGAAYQHAAHAVLRAVETRRPVVRSGNGGWSGWIDEYGYIRDTLRNEAGTIYYRGVGTLSISRDARWKGRETYYVQHGDWFIEFCMVLCAGGWILLKYSSKPEPVVVPVESEL